MGHNCLQMPYNSINTMLKIFTGLTSLLRFVHNWNSQKLAYKNNGLRITDLIQKDWLIQIANISWSNQNELSYHLKAFRITIIMLQFFRQKSFAISKVLQFLYIWILKESYLCVQLCIVWTGFCSKTWPNL